MEFNALVKAKIFPLLQKYEFKILEEVDDILQFQSSAIHVNISFNKYDKSHLIEIGLKGKILYPLSNNAVKDLFHSPLEIEQVTSETFVQNLSILFCSKEGDDMLKGNIKPLEIVVERESKDHTSDLMLKQLQETALRAWQANDYVAFIKSIDKIGINKLPQSYRLKYKMAKQKL